jgi:DNA repair exonuclease SbcCD ATPase subunit
MPPRKTTDFGALFESLVEDLRIQVAASVDRTLSDFNKRLTRIERRLDQLDPDNASANVESSAPRRVCSLCGRAAVARGLCSAHYQQWRYRERKARLQNGSDVDVPDTLMLSTKGPDLSTDN